MSDDPVQAGVEPVAGLTADVRVRIIDQIRRVQLGVRDGQRRAIDI